MLPRNFRICRIVKMVYWENLYIERTRRRDEKRSQLTSFSSPLFLGDSLKLYRKYEIVCSVFLAAFATSSALRSVRESVIYSIKTVVPTYLNRVYIFLSRKFLLYALLFHIHSLSLNSLFGRRPRSTFIDYIDIRDCIFDFFSFLIFVSLQETRILAKLNKIF